MPNIHRRVYGYSAKNKEKPLKTELGYTHETKGVKVKNPSRFWRILGLILLLPVKIIVYFFKGLAWIGRKLPQPSAQTKKLLLAKAGWLFLILVILGFLGGTIFVAWASKDLPDPDKITDRKVAQSTKIYDRTGEHLLYEVYADQKRTLVNLDQIPKSLIDGLIATEDKEFYQHRGIQPLGWIRALAYGIFTPKRVGGTSTLTQQLVRNAILTTDRSWVRKMKEIILSIRLEQKYNKDQILKIYFNEIPYGSTNYGVEAASLNYFGKHVSELNLQECATLAGMPKAPSRYLSDPEGLKNRRDFVLERMFQEGYLTREEANEAQSEAVTLERKYGDMKAPLFVLYVKEQLVEKYGEHTVDAGGLRVITTLDFEKQEAAEKAIKEISEEKFEDSQADNAGLMAMDPRSGQILAYVGSLDFNNKDIDGQFDIVRFAKRQPGSSFKPIIYSAAFEKGYTPDTILWDVLTNFAVSGKPYQPQNYDGKEHGFVTMRYALQNSFNIPAVQTLYLVGAQQGVDFAKRLGYTTLSEGEFGLSLVLGGGEVKLFDHVGAYSVFANNGTKQEPVSILKVEDSTGDILYEWKKKEGKKILDEKVTATISDVLSDDASRSLTFGTGGVLTLPGRLVAAKTGTTNNYVDAWTIGYTPSLTAGVWVGRTDNKPLKKGDGGSRLAAPIWQKFMSEALKNIAAESFPSMPENDAQKPILRGTMGGITLKIDKVTNKIATSSTPANFIVERTYIPGHSILHYVNKDDPRGPEPASPGDDPQYLIWENAIQDWIARKKQAEPDWNISFEDPPTEFDDIHSLELVPTLEVYYPAENEVISSRHIIANIKAGAPRGVSKVTYRINDKYVQTVKEPPFNLDYYASGLADGAHKLIIHVEDDIGNQIEQEIAFELKAGSELPTVYWNSSAIKLSQSDFPKMFYLNYFQLDQIAEVKIYKEKNGHKNYLAAVDLDNVFNDQLSFKWNEKPEVGVWNLIAEVKLKSGNTVDSSRMRVEIKNKLE